MFSVHSLELDLPEPYHAPILTPTVYALRESLV